MILSNYQEAILTAYHDTNDNLIIEAVPGSGKTFTAIQLAGPGVLFTAFNKHIATELCNRGVNARTFNSFGNGVVRDNVRGHIKITKWKCYNMYSGPDKYRWPVLKAVELYKNFMGRCDLDWLCDNYDVELKSRWFDLVQKLYDASCGEVNIIDFTDQKLLPIVYDWDIPQYDTVVIDEGQDICPVEAELMLRAAPRTIVFGDTNQAIYGFKGSELDGMSKLKDRLSAVELPLSICYRCPRAIVKAAGDIYPGIEAAPSATSGFVRSGVMDGGPNDMVLCRCTAPLIKSCLQLISCGIEATVLGHEIREGLQRLRDSGITAEQAVAKWKGDRLIAILDQLDALEALGTRSIASVFTGNGIQHMTIHKSKGLETDGTVYLLAPELLPHPRATNRRQEMNLKYVALTRSKKGFCYVSKNA